MGMSRVRLMGMLVATLVFAWTMLRTGNEQTSAAWHTFGGEQTISMASTTATAIDNSKKVVEQIDVSGVKPIEQSPTNVGQSEFKQEDKTGQVFPEIQKTEIESNGNKVTSEVVPAVLDKATDVSNSTTSPADELSNTLPPNPVRELTEEEKEADRKKAEQQKEKEMNQLKQHLEREHEKLRDESLRRLEHDPEMRERIKVSLDDIGVIMRTGKDVKDRLAGPLSTWASGRTPENLVIFSDQDGQFNGWRLQDAIKPWLDRPAIKDTEAAKFWRESNKPAADTSSGKTKRFSGWNLDALKFVSSVHLGYNQLRQKRDFKWYVIADDDTYWHLPTLINLLSNLDYEMEYYTGGVSYFGIAFAHGGAGAVVSAGAMKKRFIDHANSIEEYHDIGATAQYGDTNLARAFEAVGIYFDHSFRENFNGENPFHRPLDRALICQHVVTFHHLKLEFFQPFHERVKNLPIMRYIDIMATLSEPTQPMTFFWHKRDWTFNLDREDVGTAAESKNFRENNWALTVPPKYKDMLTAKACQEMCRDNEKCVAWTFIENERTCSMSEWFRIGQERQGSTSGVDAMKLADWADTCQLWWPKHF